MSLSSCTCFAGSGGTNDETCSFGLAQSDLYDELRRRKERKVKEKGKERREKNDNPPKGYRVAFRTGTCNYSPRKFPFDSSRD